MKRVLVIRADLCDSWAPSLLVCVNLAAKARSPRRIVAEMHTDAVNGLAPGQRLAWPKGKARMWRSARRFIIHDDPIDLVGRGHDLVPVFRIRRHIATESVQPGPLSSGRPGTGGSGYRVPASCCSRPIYGHAFRDGSYGFRPGRSAPQALPSRQQQTMGLREAGCWRWTSAGITAAAELLPDSSGLAPTALSRNAISTPCPGNSGVLSRDR